MFEFDHLFLPGLTSFLIAHVFYIMVYKTDTSDKNIRKDINGIAKIIIMAIYLTFGFSLLKFLYPYLADNLRIPVIAYTLTIITMSILSWVRYPKVTEKSFL